MSQAILDKLRAEYLNLTVQKKVVRAQVKAEFEAKIQVEVKKRIAEAEAEFARNLADAKETYALPVVTIQDEVFHTRTWSRWEKWRDLMGIAPERKTAEGARAAKRGTEKPYRIEDGVIYVTRNVSGPLDEEITIEKVSDVNGPVTFFPDIGDREQMDRMRTAFPGAKYVTDMSAFLVEAFEKYGDDVNEYIENPSWGGEDD